MEYYFKLEGIVNVQGTQHASQKITNMVESLEQDVTIHVTHTETAMMANDEKMEYEVHEH